MKNNTAIANRIQKNLARLKSWLKTEKIQAYRLYEKDIPEYPYIIDLYLTFAVIYEKGKRLDQTAEELQLRERHIAEIYQALKDVLNIEQQDIFFKERKRQTGKEQYTPLNTPSSRIISIIENGLNFEINLTDYLDTGLFLDHRPFRKELVNMNGEGKKLLNLFSYTSSISVCAAKSGFTTTSVDMSKTYLDWSMRNFKINQLPVENHEFINQNALEYLRTSSGQFDVIFLDPPSFSNSKKMDQTFDVIRDQVELIELTMKFLKPDGVLYFSNNATKFKLHPDLMQKYGVKDITLKSIPIDFRNQKIHSFFRITHNL